MLSIAEAAPPISRSADRAPFWRRAAREPLVHFMLLGGVIFGVTAAVGNAPNRSRVIEMPPQASAAVLSTFRATYSRDPTPAEREGLVDNWVRNEVLYREGQALGLDKGDEMIRERVIQKMNLLVFGQVGPHAPSEAELRTWFEAHRTRYDQPARISFFHLPVEGAEPERAARDLVREIAEGREPDWLPLRARVFANRDRAQIDVLFGEGFSRSLLGLPHGAWSAVASPQGWHIVRVDEVRDAVPARFEAVRDAVAAAWSESDSRAQALGRVSDLTRGYVVRRPAAP